MLLPVVPSGLAVGHIFLPTTLRIIGLRRKQDEVDPTYFQFFISISWISYCSKVVPFMSFFSSHFSARPKLNDYSEQLTACKVELTPGFGKFGQTWAVSSHRCSSLPLLHRPLPCETQDWRNTRGSDWTFSGKRCKPQAVETAGATTGILQQARRTDDGMQYADMLREKAQNTCPLFFQNKKLCGQNLQNAQERGGVWDRIGRQDPLHCIPVVQKKSEHNWPQKIRQRSCVRSWDPAVSCSLFHFHPLPSRDCTFRPALSPQSEALLGWERERGRLKELRSVSKHNLALQNLEESRTYDLFCSPVRIHWGFLNLKKRTDQGKRSGMIVRSHFFGIEPTGVNPDAGWTAYGRDSSPFGWILFRIAMSRRPSSPSGLPWYASFSCQCHLKSKACSKSWPMVWYLMPYELNEIELMTAESGGQICTFYLRTHPILCLCRNSQTPLRRSQIALSGNISTVPGQQVSLAASISTRLGITCCHRPFALPRC